MRGLFSGWCKVRKFGRIFEHEGVSRIGDPVEIPDVLPPWAESPAAFIARMFPDYPGFFELPAGVDGGWVWLDGDVQDPASFQSYDDFVAQNGAQNGELQP